MTLSVRTNLEDIPAPNTTMTTEGNNTPTLDTDRQLDDGGGRDDLGDTAVEDEVRVGEGGDSREASRAAVGDGVVSVRPAADDAGEEEEDPTPPPH